MFTIYQLNIISEHLNDQGDISSLFAHVEVEKDTKELEAEAFALNIIVDPDLDKEFELRSRMLIVKEFDLENITRILQKYIDDLNVLNWNELKIEIERYFYWI